MKIKPLVWEENNTVIIAQTPIGTYHIWKEPPPVLHVPRGKEIVEYASVEEAKAAAEAHYQGIVKECLEDE